MRIDIIWWFHISFYDVNLSIKLTKKNLNVSFVPLSDLMPHLKPNVQQTFMVPQSHLNTPSVKKKFKIPIHQPMFLESSCLESL
jgi:hypothetical protein